MKIKFFYRTLILLNIFFLLYYSTQLLVFTDEFAISNIGFFNHAIAGLCEIIGIIFFSLAIGLCIIFFIGTNNQLPLLSVILLIQFLIAINFWKYVLSNSPGESNIDIITSNAILFSFATLIIFVVIIGRNN